jgi:hypothetical protein
MDGHTFVFMILSITKEFVIIFSGFWKKILSLSGN